MGDIKKTLMNFATGYVAGYALKQGIEHLTNSAANKMANVSVPPQGNVPNYNQNANSGYQNMNSNQGSSVPSDGVKFKGEVAKYMNSNNTTIYDSIEDTPFLE